MGVVHIQLTGPLFHGNGITFIYENEYIIRTSNRMDVNVQEIEFILDVSWERFGSTYIIWFLE